MCLQIKSKLWTDRKLRWGHKEKQWNNKTVYYGDGADNNRRRSKVDNKEGDKNKYNWRTDQKMSGNMKIKEKF